MSGGKHVYKVSRDVKARQHHLKKFTPLVAMSTDERQALEALKDAQTSPNIEGSPVWNGDSEEFSFSDVWNGTEALPISHAGGEFTDLAKDVLGDLWKMCVLPW